MADGTYVGGDMLRWKRRAEHYLLASGLPYTIVHAGPMLTNDPGGKRKLVYSLNDAIATSTQARSIPRPTISRPRLPRMFHTPFSPYVTRHFFCISAGSSSGFDNQGRCCRGALACSLQRRLQVQIVRPECESRGGGTFHRGQAHSRHFLHPSTVFFLFFSNAGGGTFRRGQARSHCAGVCRRARE